MKKLLVSILCLLTVTCVALGMVGCNKKTNSKTSEKESVKESVSVSVPESESAPESESEPESVQESISTHEHSYTVLEKDDNQHWYECECGEPAANRENHGYDEGVVTKNPTETEEGEILYTCTTCGATKTGTIPCSEHVHDLEKITGTPATCTEDGVMDRWECSGCDHVYLDERGQNEFLDGMSLVIPKINHANEVVKSTVKPRCGVEGETVYFCPDCERERSEAIDALEHDWKTVEVVEANCQEGGYTLQQCANCLEYQSINPTEKTDCDEEYVLVSDSSCLNTGLAKYVCNDCKAEREIILPKHDHEYKVLKTVGSTCTEGGYTVYQCEHCESSYKDDPTDSLGGHDYVVDEDNCIEATCLQGGVTVYVCSRGCGAGYREEIEALGHDIVDATCESEGYCTRCDDVSIAKKSHSYEITKTVDPTCTQDGYVESTCGGCGDVKTEVPAEYKAKGHNEAKIKWTEEEIKVEGETCKYFVKTSGTCPDCSTLIVYEGEAYDSHAYVCVITTPSTCVSEGVKTYTCQCGDSYTKNYEIDESAHMFGSGVQEGNYLVYTCSHNEEHTERVLHIVEEAVDADVVKEAEKLAVGDATLKLDESTKGQLGESSSVALSAGTLDGEELESAKSKLNEDQLELLGESKIYNFEMEVDGAPVTQFDGYITIRIPYELDGEDPENIIVWYIEGDTPVLIEAKYIEIDGEGFAEFATNHFSYYSVAKMTPAERCAKYGCYTDGSVTVLPATCLEGGYTLTVCRRCGKKTYTDRVAALGHDWAEVEELHVDVSCTQDGYQKHECQRCQVYYEVKAPAHGHEWVKNSERTVLATCSSEGSTVFECVHCDNEYVITEKKTPHKYTNNIVEATCTTSGYTECVCGECGYTTIKNPTSALGHNIIDKVHAPTCIDKGYTSHTCSRCGEVFANTDFTETTEHEWDRESPTCEEDKRCKHCKKRDENNGKAHGHFMEDGKCKHCSKPCNHTFEYSHSVESTCSGSGYDVWVCKHCQASEFRGETGVASHSLTLLKEVAPTCQTAGYKIEVCRACGYTQTTETSPAVDHAYEDGECIYCGHLSEIQEGYIDVVGSIKNFNGITIKINEYDIEQFEIVGDKKETDLKVTALKALELMVYVDENGELHGAATGAVQIYNGPVRSGYATYAFKGIIKGDGLYVLVEVQDANDYEIYISLVVEELIRSAIDSTITIEGFEMLKASGVIELLDEIATSKNSTISNIVTKAVELLFSSEEIGGERVYSLDFDKLHELNDDLAHMSAKDAIEKHLGKDVLGDLKGWARKIAFLKFADLPAFVTENGLPYDSIIAVINNFAKMSGAPEDYDVGAMINDPNMAEVTVGELIFGEEFDFGQMMEMVDVFQEYPVYLVLLGAEDETLVEEVYEPVKAMIDMLRCVNLSFTTDLQGLVSKVQIGVDSIEIPVSSTDSISISFDVELIVNGKIDVTWDGICEDIDKEIILPEGLEDKEELYNYGSSQDKESIEIDGEKYTCMAFKVNQGRRIYYYSMAMGAVAKADCGDWIEYMLMVPSARQEITVGVYAALDGMNVKYYLVAGEDNSYILPLTVSEEGNLFSFNSILGEIVTVDIEEFQNGEINLFRLAEQAYGKIPYTYSRASLDADSIFYNKATGEYSGESHHNFVLDEDNSYAPSGCTDSGLRVYNCTECGETFKQSYTNGHRMEMHYKLSAGSTSCDDGLDAYYMCTVCGKMGEYYENWTFGHEYKQTRVLKDGKAIVNRSCYACGIASQEEQFTLDSDYAIELYTGIFGISAGKPNSGLGGSMGGSSQEKIDGFIFKFVPSSDATIEIYSWAKGSGDYLDFRCAVYDSNFTKLKSEYSNLEYGHFGITCDFQEGKTYYIIIGSNNYNGADAYVSIKEVKVETVDLAGYGCDCGGEMVITSTYGKKTVQINANCDANGCSACGFSWSEETLYKVGEYCEEIESGVCRFYNENTQESYEYVVYEKLTGNAYHKTNGDKTEEHLEGVDANGNPITIRKTTYLHTCEICGNVIQKKIEERHYDTNGQEIYYAYSFYNWSISQKECVINSKNESTYTYYVSDSGYTESRIATDKKTYYNKDGTLDYWEAYEYTYYPSSECKVTRKETTSYGYENETTYFNHHTSHKEIPEESYVEEVELDGVLVTKKVVAMEEYCRTCGASLHKNVSIIYEDSEQHEIRIETYSYVAYAESQTVYGWEIEEEKVHTYGVFKYNDLASYTYLLSTKTVRYAEGSRGQEIIEYRSYRYEYDDVEKSCECTVYESFGEDKERSYRDSIHIARDRAVLLSPGAETCLDGCSMYEVCYSCGYQSEQYEHSNSHYVYSSYHLDNREVVRLADYGQACNGYVEIIHCPCGEMSAVNTDHAGCDFESKNEHLGDEHWKETFSCAVSEPMCGFVYTYEYWTTRGEGCKAISHERWVIGENTDNPLIVENSYYNGSYYHSYVSSNTYSETYEEDGYSVYYTSSERFCELCSHVNYKTENWSYREVCEDGSMIEVKEKNLYTHYNYSGEVSSTNYSERELIYSADRAQSAFVTILEKHTYYEKGSEYSWDQTQYVYSDCIHTPVTIETNSGGYRREYKSTHDYYDYDFNKYVVTPTCTQSGTEYRVCGWCQAGETYEHGCFDHNYDYVYDAQSDSYYYVCTRCDLINFTGHDGNVIMEDMTADGGEEFVVGYHFYEYFDYVIAVSLVVEGQEEPIVLSIDACDDGKSLITVDFESVKAACEELGLAFEEVMVKVTILPTNGDYSFDYSVTMDSHQNA